MNIKWSWENYMMNLKIGNKIIDYPIIQGGMGVGISLGNLSGSVAKEGAMGTIAMVGIGYREEDFYDNSLEANKRAFRKEFKKAREISKGHGLIGTNIMVAVNDYEELVAEAVKGEIDFIISGAGLPLKLPELVGDEDVLIAPVISSLKAFKLINKVWSKRYNRFPDFVVVEGSDAGGHLGFKMDNIRNGQSLKEITLEIVNEIENIKNKTGISIPIFVAGSVYDGYDLKEYRKLGATGIQIGTRFIGTEECDANKNFKKLIVKSTKEDLIIIESPVGLPGRAIKNEFLEEVKNKRRPSKRCIKCLKTCVPKETPYCILDALINGAKGDIKNGLFFSGSNVERVDKIISVKEIIKDIEREFEKI